MMRLSRLRSSRQRRLQTLVFVLIFAIPAVAQSVAQSQAASERRVDSLLKQLTLEEKVDLIGGVDDFYIRAVPKIGA